MAKTGKTATTTKTTTTTRNNNNKNDNHPTTTSDNQPKSNMTVHSRFNVWVALMVLSLVSMLSVIALTRGKSQRSFQERWSLVVACISMCLAFVAAVGHVVIVVPLRQTFVSSIMELIMAIAAVMIWMFGIPMMTSPENGLAVVNFKIVDANLYFASWGAFIVALWLMVSVGHERGVSAARDGFARLYSCLIVSSLIAMSSAARMYDTRCNNANNNNNNSEFCSELKLGLCVAVLSAVLAAVMTLLLYVSPNRIPMVGCGFFCCVILVLLWCYAVALLTFQRGPGSAVGTLFFSTWTSALLALDLFVCYIMAFLS